MRDLKLPVGVRGAAALALFGGATLLILFAVLSERSAQEFPARLAADVKARFPTGTPLASIESWLADQPASRSDWRNYFAIRWLGDTSMYQSLNETGVDINDVSHVLRASYTKETTFIFVHVYFYFDENENLIDSSVSSLAPAL
jgi:hypothetical protein